MIPDPQIIADYRAAIAENGVSVTFRRQTGFAPNITITSATVTAKVSTMGVETTAPAQDGMAAAKPGAMSQTDRLVLVLASDLTAQGFPLPVIKGDKVVLPGSDEAYTVLRADPYKRAVAGAIEVVIAGVA
jgi:hypothetical protein